MIRIVEHENGVWRVYIVSTDHGVESMRMIGVVSYEQEKEYCRPWKARPIEYGLGAAKVDLAIDSAWTKEQAALLLAAKIP